MAQKGKKRFKKVQQALEKRLMLDAAAVFAAVEAISNSVFHLDAQDIDGDNDRSAGDQPADGATVGTWADGVPTPQNNQATAGGTAQATYDDDAFGVGRGGLKFDGVNDEYVITNQNDINASGPWPEKSFAFTFRTGTDTSSFQVIYEQGGGTRGYQVAIADGNLYVSGYNNTGSEWGADRFKVMNHGAIAANTTYNVIMVFDVNEGPTGTIKSNVNGGNFIALESIGAQANHTAAIGIGGINNASLDPRTLAFPNDGANFSGWIGEIWQWNKALTDQEISDVESYQALKWTNRPTIELNEGGTVIEGGTFNINNTLLNALDNNTADTALTYQVTSTLNGSVTLSGSALAVGGTFTQDDINNNRVAFVHDSTDTVTASFDFRLTDGGTLLKDTFVLDVTPVDDIGDDPPVVSTNEQGVVLAGGTATITSALLQTTDVDTVASSLTYTVIATTDGSLFNTNLGMIVTSFTQADINSGFIDFQHDGTLAIPAGFNFDVSDGTTTISDSFRFDVNLVNTAANDPPVLRNNTGDEMSPSSEVNLFTSNLQTIDPDNSINQLTYTITSLTDGNVRRGGVSLTVGQTFTQADIDFGIVSFLHNGGVNATAGFDFNVSDGNSTISGTYTIDVVVNTAPTISALGPFSIAENATNGLFIGSASGFDADFDGLTYSIQSGNGDGIFQINPINGDITIDDNTNLNFEAASSYSLVVRVTDDGSGNLFDEITVVINITDVNEAPVLTASGPFNVAEDAADTDAVGSVPFSDEDVPADSITYSIAGGSGLGLFAIDNSGNITVDGNSNFDFEGGTTSYTLDIVANDGALDSNTVTVTVNITNVDDAPVLDVNAGGTVAEGGNFSITTGELSSSDTDTADTALVYNVSNLVNGQVELTSSPGTGVTSFTQDDLVNGLVVFVHDGSETVAGSFDFAVSDGTTTLATDTFALTVTPVNDAPELTVTNPADIAEGGTASIDAVVLAGTDADDAATDITYTVSNLVNGQVELTSSPGTAVTTFTQDDVDNGLVVFVHDGTDTLTSGFDVSLADGGEDGATPATGTVTIGITPIDDAPVLDVNAGGTVAEGGNFSITTGELSSSDTDTADTALVYNVSNLVNGQVELTSSPGTGVTSFTQDDLVNGLVVFVHDGSETVAGSFDFAVSDGTTTLATDTFALTVTPVNDAPELTVTNPADIAEGGTASIDAVVLAGTDADDAATDITYTVSNLVNGQVELTSSPGTAVTTFTQDDVDNGLVVFVHDGTDTLTSGFDVSLADGGEDGATPATGTVTIGITPIDDAPVLDVNAGGTVAEGGNFSITTGELSSSDTDTADTALVYNVSNLVNGQVELTSSPGTGVTSFTQDDLVNGLVVFVHDGSETVAGSFDFAVSDGTTTLATDTFALTVTPVNDAPELTVTNPADIAEGGTASIDAVVLAGTDADDAATDITYTVSNLVNGQVELTSSPGTAVTTFTQDDVDNGLVVFVHDGTDTLTSGFDVSLADGGEDGATPATGTVTIGITPIDDAPVLDVNAGGTVAEGGNFSITTGELSSSDTDTADTALVYNVSNLVNGQVELTSSPGTGVTSFTQDDLVNGLVVFVHDGSETVAGSFDFAVSDGTTTLATDTFALTVTPVNDAPELTVTNPADIAEGGTASIDAVVLAGTDADDAATDITYTVSNLVNGQVELTSSPGTAVTTFTQDDVDNGLVVFVHDGTDTLTSGFDVSLADGGEDGATPATGTVTIGITPIDDAPVLDVNAGGTVAEGGNFSITTGELSSSDTDTADTALVYNVSNLVNGQVELTSSPGTGVTSFTQDDLVNGLVVFVHDGSETVAGSFDFAVSDGTTTLATDTFALTVTPVNDAPELTVTNPADIAEGGTASIDAVVLAGTDADDAATDITYTVSNLVNGQVELTSSPGTAVTTFTQDDVDNGLVVFVHDGTDTLTSGFDVSLADGGEDGATPATGTVTIGITPIDDAPVLDVNAGGTVAEGGNFSITTGELSSSDTDTADTALVYNVSNLVNGQVELTSSPGTGVTSFTQDDLVNGLVVFVHDGSETVAGSFDFAVSDGTTTLATDTFALTVTPVNDAPELTVTNPADIAEGGTASIDAVVLAGTDADDAATDITYTVSNLVNGQVELTSSPGTAVTTFTQDDVDNGLVVFVHDGTDTLTSGFDVSLADGGEDGATPATGTVTIGITPIDDAPVLDVNAGGTVAEGGNFSITTGELSSSDTDTADTALVYNVSNLVNGQVELTSSPGTGVTSFTQDDLVNGLVVFVHDGSETVAGSFDFAVSDGTTTLATDTFALTVTPVNDAPELTVTNPADIAEGGTASIDAVVLAGTDADDAATDITYTVSNLVNGQVELTSSPGTAVTTFTQDDVDNGLVVFVHDGTDTLTSGFDVSLADGGEDGATPATGTVTIGITPIDDAPVLDVNAGGTVAEGGNFSITTGELSSSDTDTADTALVYNVSNLVNGQVELTSSPGTGVTSFTQDDLVNGLVVFVHDGSETVAGSFDFAVSDGTTTLATDTFALTVTPVNDAPELTVTNPADIAEGGTASIDAVVLAGTDADDAATDITYTVSNLVNGQVELTSSPGTAVTTFTQDDVDNGLVVFVHDGTDTLTSGFDVSLADGGEDGATPATGTVTIGITPIDDAPVLDVNAGGTVAEGGNFSITTGELSSSDTDTADTALVYNVSNLVNGQVELTSSPGTGVTSFTQDDLVNGLVVFVHDGSETVAGSFDFAVSDGTTTLATDTFALTVTPVNDAPELTVTNPADIAEGGTASIDAVVLAGTDADDAATDITYTVSNLVNGQVELTSSPGTAVTTFTQDDVDNGLVVFVHDGTDTLTSGFDVSLADGGEDGATPATGTVTIGITPIDDAPVLDVNAGGTVAEGGNFSITTGELSSSDTDTADTALVYNVSNLVNGQVELTSSPGTGVTSFTQDDLVNGLVVFVHDGSETVAGSFDFAVSDGTTTLATDTFALTVTPVNDAPELTVTNPADIAEGGTASIDAVVLAGTDADDAATDITYTVSNLVNGQVELTSSPGTAVTTFTQDDVDNGLVVFVHDGTDTLTSGFDVSLADGGEDGATPATGTVTIGITPIDDAPVLDVNAGGTVAEGGNFSITTGELSSSDTDTADTALVYNVSNLVNGQVELTSSPGTGVTSFTQDDLVNGLVVFVHDGSETVAGSFDFAVSDGTTTLATDTFALTVTPVNDAPELTVTNPADIAEGGTASIDAVVLAGTDADDLPADLTYTVSNIQNGQVELTSNPGVGITTFTQDDVDNGLVRFVHDSSETATGSFDVSLVDDDGAGPATGTVTIGVLPVNDAPTLTTANPADILEGGTASIDNTILTGVDSDDAATDITYTVSNLVNGQMELTTNPGVAVTTFTQDDVDNGLVVFVHDGSETTAASFDVSLADGGEDGAMPATGSIAINVIPVNDAPQLTVANPADIPEGGTAAIDSTVLTGTDADDLPADLTYTVSNIQNGQVELTSNPGVGITTFTQDDVDNGLVRFVHDSSETATGSFDVSLVDDDGAGPATGTVTIGVLPVNDAPTLTTANPADILEGGTASIDNTILTGVDSDDAATDITYTVSNLVNGQMELTTNPGVAVTTFTQDDVDNGLVVFVHDGSETTAASFDVSLADGGEDGAMPATGSIAINVIPVNDAPQLTVANPADIPEGGTAAIDSTVLTGTDADDLPADLTYTVSNIQNGQVELTSNPGVGITTFTQDDVDNGLVRFVHDSSETATGSFDVSLVDDDGAGPATGTVTIGVLPVNDAPTLTTANPADILEGGTASIDNTILTGVDSDDAATDITYTVSNLVNGQMELTTNPGVAVTTFTQDDVDNGLVVFVHDGSETTAASFDVSLADGGEDGAMPATGSIAINVIPVNDAPTNVFVDNTSFEENLLIGTSIAELTVADVDGPFVTYSIVGAPGIFAISGDQLILTASADYEAGPQQYTITLRAFDGEFFVDKTFTFNVLNEFDTPAISPTTTTTSTSSLSSLITTTEFEPNTFFPIDNMMNDLGFGSGGENVYNEILRWSVNSPLNFYYSDSDVSEIIRDEVTTEIADILKDKLEGEADESQEEIDVEEQIATILTEDTDTDEDNEGEEGIESNILRALLGDKSENEESDPDIEEDIPGIFMESTNIQLDDAAIYYKNKVSNLEKVLLSKSNK